MKQALYALAIASILPFPAFADKCDFYQSRFMTHWALTKDNVVYETTDTVSGEPAYVIDTEDRMPDGRYALAIQDTASCTFDVISGNMSRIMYYMEEHVYNRIEGNK